MSSKNVLEEGKNSQTDLEKAPDACSRESLDAKTGEAKFSPLNGTSPNKKSSGNKRGWREIEALRERKALKEMLAEIWDDDFDLDESIFGEAAENASLYRKSDGNGGGVTTDGDLFDADADIDDEFYGEDEV